MGDADDLELGTMNPLDGLLDELLVEILCRLPCSKSAVRCKCVCKRWLALISHPYFTSSFIVHKSQQQANNVPFSIVYGPHMRNFFTFKGIINKGILLYTNEDEPPFGFRGSYTVNYPPWCEPDGEVSMKVYGACYDLLLCCRNPARSRDYCLYNPRTRRYLQLPDPPRRQQPVTMGLVCDPYYSLVDVKPLVLDASYRFYAACFRIPGKPQSSNQVKLKVDIFSSEIWGWRKMVLYSPKPFLLHACHNMVFVYGGMLYTYSISGILGFDPRESDHEGVSVIRGHFIDWPDGRVNGYPSTSSDRFSVADARLLFSHCDPAGKLSIWQLEDQDKWSLKYKVCLKELVSRNSTLSKYAERQLERIWLFGVHPFCKDVIYLRLDYHIVLCNLREKVLKIVSRAPRDRICSDYFWLVYPWWPTPMRTTCRGLPLLLNSDATSE